MTLAANDRLPVESAYADLFNRYMVEMRAARDDAVRWWTALLEAAGDDTTSVHSRWPVGPTSHPRVIAVYRKYFLECEHLAARLLRECAARSARAGRWEDDEADELGLIAPVQLLVVGLEPVDPDLSKFMQPLIFSPIGMNVDGDIA